MASSSHLHRRLAVLYDPIKLPWVLVFTLLLCLPSLYIFSCYLGTRLGAAADSRARSSATAVISAILIGFGPVTWFFMFTAPAAMTSSSL